MLVFHTILTPLLRPPCHSEQDKELRFALTSFPEAVFTSTHPPTDLTVEAFLKKILGFSLWLFLTTNYQSLLEKQYMLTK